MTIDHLLDPDNALAAVRYQGIVRYYVSNRENWILDWTRWRDDFIAAGHAVPPLAAMGAQRAGIAVVDRQNAERFLAAKGVHPVDVACLRTALVTRCADAQSWWDVEFLFPVAFVDVDERRLAAFYSEGPRLERYVPHGWTGEFADFASSHPPDRFPAAARFWVVDGCDLLRALIERGRQGGMEQIE